MKIVVNARFLTQNITGVQRFAFEISKRIKMLYDDVVFVSPRNIVLKDGARLLDVHIIGHTNGHLWEQIELPLWLKKHGTPLLINLCNMAPVFYRNKISTVHDITFKRFPHTYSWKFRKAYEILIPLILKSSRHIFTVSEFSLNEITSFYKIPKAKIHVIYNAVDKRFTHIEDERLRKENYIFAVSSIKENKNFQVALDAFLRTKKQLVGLKMFIAGEIKANNFGSLDLSKYVQNPSIKFLGRISDDDLIRYYSNAMAFIFPSFYEGFGIPVLEAQACGCPVISSNTSSLPEVLGDSALLCEPHSISEFVDAIMALHDSPSLRQELIERGGQNIMRFTWERSARNIVEVIKCLE